MIVLIDRHKAITRGEAQLLFSLIPEEHRPDSQLFCVLPEGRSLEDFKEASKKVWEKLDTYLTPEQVIVAFGSASKSIVPQWKAAPFSVSKITKGSKTFALIGMPASADVIPGWGIECYYSAKNISEYLREIIRKARSGELKDHFKLQIEEESIEVVNQGTELPRLAVSVGPEALRDFLKAVDFSRPLSLDLETTGLLFYKAKILSIALSQRKDSGEIVSVFTHWDQTTKELMKDFLERAPETLLILGANLKFDFLALAWEWRAQKDQMIDLFTKFRWGDVILRFISQDTSRVRAKSLKYLAARYLYWPDYTLAVTQSDSSRQTLHGFFAKQEAGSDTESYLTYNVLDTIAPILLWEIAEQDPSLSSYEISSIYWIILERISKLLFAVSLKGVHIDWAKCQAWGDILKQGLEEKKAEIQKLSSITNPNSTKQVVPVLKALGVDLSSLKRTDSGELSINAENLEALLEKLDPNSKEYTLIQALYQYRSGRHLLANFLDPEVWKRYSDDEGILHSDYNQHQVSSGRLSSSSPNLQQVGALRVIFKAGRLAFDAYDKVKNIRELFIPPSPSEKVGEIDGSQMELRIFALLMQDPELLSRFRAQEDLYKSLASLVHNKPMDQITTEERSWVKTMTLGALYGVSLRRAIALIKNADPESIKRTYFLLHSKVKGIDELAQWGEHQVASRANTPERWSDPVRGVTRERVLLALEGFVYTPDRFKRVFYDLKSSILNFPVQGFASDVMLQMAWGAWKNWRKAGLSIFNVVHDSFLFSGTKELLEEFKDWAVRYLPEVLTTRCQFLTKEDLEFFYRRLLKYFPSKDGFYEIPRIEIDFGMGSNWGTVQKSVQSSALARGLVVPDNLRLLSSSFYRILPILEVDDALAVGSHILIQQSRVLVPVSVFSQLKTQCRSGLNWIGTRLTPEPSFELLSRG